MVTMVGERIIEIINLTIQKRGRCTVALTGGKTPRDVYSLLGDEFNRDRVVDWQRVQLFWGDERIVPPEHQDSNYRMAKLTLLDHIEIPAENVHRMHGEIPPEKAAAEYDNILNEKFKENPPVFDLILLGLGEDGHIASLFPGTDALEEKEKYAVPLFVAKLNTWRITLTLPVLNAAKNVIFIVSGKLKVKIVQRIVNAKQPDKELPATMLQPKNGSLEWMLDSEAAALL